MPGRATEMEKYKLLVVWLDGSEQEFAVVAHSVNPDGMLWFNVDKKFASGQDLYMIPIRNLKYFVRK
jgi:hypothetical protein